MIKTINIYGKTIPKLFCLIFAFLWILMAYNTKSADAQYYQMLYNRVSEAESQFVVEFGFVYLMKLAQSIDLSYRAFLCMFTLVGMLLLSSTVLKYSRTPNVVFLFYALYPFLLDVAQIRQFMIMSIFVFAIRYLSEFSIRNMFTYIGCVLLASTQQITAFALLVFLFLYLSDDKKIIKHSMYGVALSLVFGTALFSSSLFSSIVSLRDNYEVDYWGGMKGENQFLMYAFFFFVLIGILYLTYKRIPQKSKFDTLFLKIGLFSSIFIPFMLYDFQYSRLFRLCLIPIYIGILNNCIQLNNSLSRLTKLIVYLMIFMVAIRLFGPSSGYFQSLTEPIFKNNIVLNYIFQI